MQYLMKRVVVCFIPTADDCANDNETHNGELQQLGELVSKEGTSEFWFRYF